MDELAESTPLALLPKDSTTKKINFKKNFKVTLASNTVWSDSALERLLEDSTIQWYTDGSKTPEGIGAGIAGPRTKLSIPIGEECIERLNRMSLCNRVHLIWVPGHKGVEGNEKADELARTAAASKMLRPEPYIA
ncbi:PREDICTED: uncharacterized protein LOC108976091, partial [Bactrocera latifrons]|uniref:uncharacterized protein LOC108976091 n=1 Tax=Bactrocera latifrons TaxID=174628 RepID=UPI0008DD967C